MICKLNNQLISLRLVGCIVKNYWNLSCEFITLCRTLEINLNEFNDIQGKF